MENYYAAFGAFFLILLLFALGITVVLIIAQWKIFTKAGKPGWACIVPIYNIIVLLEIIGKPTWWILLFLIPCVNIVFYVWTINLLSKSFGKDEGFTVGLLLLGIIFYPILAFGDAVYVGPAAAEANAANRFDADDYQQPTDLN